MSVAFGLEQMQPRKFVIVVAISCGGQSRSPRPASCSFLGETDPTRLRPAVALASYGEIAFDWQGFICQALGIAFEAARLVCIQKLLTGLKMGPVSYTAVGTVQRAVTNPSACSHQLVSLYYVSV